MINVSDNILIIAYLLVWVATLVWYQRKQGRFDGGSAIIFSYVLYAVFSVLTINDEIFSRFFEPLSIFPFIYLYVMLMMALSPAIYHHVNPVKEIENPHTRILKLTSILIIVCSVMLVPDIIKNFNQGLVMLFTDVDAGKDAYMDQLENAGDSGSAISNLASIIYNSLSDIAIFLFFYFLTVEKKNIWLVIGLFFSIFIGLLTPVMSGQRTGVILGIFTITMSYFLFRQFLSRRLNKIMQAVGIITVVAITLPVVALTMSRFGDRTAGVTGYLNWYVGQGNLYFNNYALDCGGTRNGDRVLNLFKQIVDSDTPKNFVERRAKYTNLEINDELFSTFVGDFAIDFGPISAFIIFIVFNALVLYLIRRQGDTVKVHQMLLLYFTMCICMQGGMYLFAYSDTANLKMITLVMLYVYLRYHDELLEKFPKK